ncbi:MAG: hypothetical protein AMJ90_08280 [candidate division Zixibacteria bacterium SM23_73_2]|nr:MAG: hypothetical protein AMJ90_08280 [candidate division Zixibacteria bacterium SM23_73_2]
MKDNNRIEYERWFKQAGEDLEVAKWSLKGRFFSHSCFMSQQAGEKALKAYCYLKGERLVLGHSMLILIRKCSKYNKDFIHLEKECKTLDKYYIISRYPNGLPGLTPSEYFDQKEAKEALNKALKIIKFVEKK